MSESESLVEGGWRPIETAPKDGTLIDIWVPGRGGGHRLTDVRWERRVTRWTTGDEYGEWGWGLPSPDGPRPTPTHWMPRPAPPA